MVDEGREGAPSITAVLKGGPLDGRRLETEVVQGRPPGTIDAPDDHGATVRYCLVEWTQSGPSAAYEFLYVV
jgi:hypothetical protein